MISKKFRTFSLVLFSLITSTILFILFPLTSYGIAKPTVDVVVDVKYAKDPIFGKLAESVLYSQVVNSKQLEVVLKDALKNLSDELRLQDLLSTSNIILADQRELAGTLNIVISFEVFERREFFNEYIKNSLSGDYLYYQGKYIKIYVNERYKIDYSGLGARYISSPDGTFVKGYDDKYYPLEFSNLYSKAPHTDVSFAVKVKVEYYFYLIQSQKSVLQSQGSFIVSKNFQIVTHRYDPYNNKLLREEKSLYEFGNDFANTLKENLKLDLRMTSTKDVLKGIVEEVKFPRVLINLGEDDGVRKGMTFGIKDGENLIGELVVERVAKNYSECQVTFVQRRKNITVGMDVFSKSPESVFPFGFRFNYIAGLDFSLENSSIFFGISLKEFNLYREVTSQIEAGFLLGLSSNNSQNAGGMFWLNTLYKFFGENNSGLFAILGLGFGEETQLRGGVLAKIGYIGLEVSVALNAFDLHSLTNTLKIGGGVVW